MSSLVEFLFSTTGIVSAFFISSVGVCLRPLSRTARSIALLLACGFLLASVYAVPSAIASTLLTRNSQTPALPAKSDLPTVIVLLGGGGDTARVDDAQIGLMNDETAARTLAAYRVYQRTGASWIISSGGLVTQRPPDETSAVMMRDALVALGVPAAKILLETQSRDTRDEARVIAPMLRRLGPATVVVVTSDIHMPRAQAAFRAEGISTVPASAPDTRRPVSITGWILPSSHGLQYTEQVVHELLGNVYYAIR